MTKLTGNVKLILENTKTGHTNVVLDKNMITDAVKDILSQHPFNMPWVAAIQPLYYMMYGGVLCFNLPLSSDPQEYSIPLSSENSVIAHAGYTLPNYPSISDSTKGTPIENDLIVTENSVTQVWEWDESHGNGVISSVGLCPSAIGYLGTAINTYSRNYHDISLALTTQSYIPTTSVAQDASNYILDIYNGYAYSFAVDGSNIKIYRTPIPSFSDISLIDPRFRLNTENTQEISIVAAQDTHITDNKCYYYFELSKSKLYLYTANSNSLYFTEIDITARTANTSVHTYNNISAFYEPSGIFPALKHKDYIYYFLGSPTESTYYRIDNIVRISLDSWESDQVNINTKFYTSEAFYVFSTGDRLLALDWDYGCIIFEDKECYVLKDDNGGSYPLFVGNSGCGNMKLCNNMYCTFDMNIVNRLYIDNFCLTTKFNLPKPVEKTSDVKMRLEYTLMEVPENG